MADLGSREAIEDARVGLKDRDAQGGVVLQGFLITALLLHDAQLLSALQHGQDGWQHACLLHTHPCILATSS